MRVRCDVRADDFDARGVAAHAKSAGDAALARAAWFVCARSTAIAPKRSGALIASARVETAAGRATVSYGAPYAVIQHERTSLRHPGGGQAKYLQSAVRDGAAARELERDLAQELRARL